MKNVEFKKMSLANIENRLTQEEMENIMAGSGFGDCMGDIYGNHGWVSAWAWIQSAYIPATVVAFSVACLSRN